MKIEFGAALTIQNHDIPSSLRWLDAQFETENMLVAQNGKIGDTLILRGYRALRGRLRSRGK